MHRLFDDVDNGKKHELVLSRKKFHAKAKLTAHKVINDFRLPEILALQEVENINTLRVIIRYIQQAGGPRYQAVLKDGNDVSGMDTGFLIKAEIRIESIEQLFKGEKIKPENNPLFSRPPLYIRVCRQFGCISILNLHLRSMRGIRKKTYGQRVRIKRREQASTIARWLDQYQRSHPTNSVLVLGDFNALTPTDQYIDVVGIIKGTPDNRKTLLTGQDLIQNDLIDLTKQIPLANRYSYIHRKKKQIIDYMLVNQQFKPKLINIRFSKIDYQFSDHAGLIADFSW